MKRFIFCNVGWMNRYQGLDSDSIINGGEHVKKYGWGNEIFNFLDDHGKHYGYVEVGGSIRLERLGAELHDDQIGDVTVIWTATNPKNGGTYIVGWYKNATLFRERQTPTLELSRRYSGKKLDYSAVAESKNCKLLPLELRTMKIPRGKDGMGEKNIWYGDTNPSFIENVRQLILNDGIATSEKDGQSGKSSDGRSWQRDPIKRALVEKHAIEVVESYYVSQGFDVTSVEKDNIGWDLNASNGRITLKLEVKGLSGQHIVTELTPNEYSNLKEHKHDYRLCIVTEALTKPKLSVFRFLSDSGRWVSQDGVSLRFQDLTGARITEYTI